MKGVIVTIHEIVIAAEVAALNVIDDIDVRRMVEGDVDHHPLGGVSITDPVEGKTDTEIETMIDIDEEGLVLGAEVDRDL